MKIMGIVNVTPDSFFDGGKYFDSSRAIAHAYKLLEEGADVIDVGGESTRPGSESVDEDEELRRVLPVIRELARCTSATISIDTQKPAVAKASLESGATMVNDVSASLASVAKDFGASIVIMHMKGAPKTMQINPQYDDVIEEISSFLRTKALLAKDLGIKDIWIDPGIGFGKTVAHNLIILKNVSRFKNLGYPILIGTSRKSFLGRLTKIGDEDISAESRLWQTMATVGWALFQNVDMVRVHDVREAFDLKKLFARCHKEQDKQIELLEESGS